MKAIKKCYFNGALVATLFLMLILFFSNQAMALSWTELDDAGQLLGTAQSITGQGSIDSIGGALTGYDDIDLYQFYIHDPSAFSTTISASLSEDNDAQMFLFDSEGYLVLEDDDDGEGYLPQFNTGDLYGYDPGLYYLAFDLFNTDPVGDPLSGWDSDPAPQQEGSYELTLTASLTVDQFPRFGWTELDDAGQLLHTAQVTEGEGDLVNISGALTGYDDVDLYQIYIDNPSVFSTATSASLSEDNDAQMFLFDSEGYLVLEDDDDGYDLLPQFTAGELDGYDPGLYYLAFDLFYTYPAGDPLSGWDSFPNPQQEGSYQLNLNGVLFATGVPVPEPATMLLLGSGLIGLAGARRKKFKK